MASFLARRFGQAAIVAMLVSLLTFLLMRLAPGDPAELIAMARSGERVVTIAEMSEIRAAEGLDAPLPIQYGLWLSRAIQGDLGRSLVTSRPVLTEIASRLPATLELAAGSLTVALLAALPLGILAAARKDTLIDHVLSALTVAGAALPAFWLGYLLILLFAVHFIWLPTAGNQGWRSLILPVLSIAPGLAAVTGQVVKGNMIELFGVKYVRTARAKGLQEQTVLLRHVLPNAMAPVLSLAGLQFALLLEGALVIEAVFAWPGLGSLLVSAVLDRDYPVVQGSVLVIALFFVLANLASDIAQALIDPRVREWRAT
jgi:peptide/nickel transport system permease protein